ncbi:MAG: DNA internalization-related competence protein ComEC/Rec2 [Candidatus Lernaella stagnicola]|nr:DNA internalization-related competence protein ComEC/Rec2 [Candidatus Lernaella stagnicola]
MIRRPLIPAAFALGLGLYVGRYFEHAVILAVVAVAAAGILLLLAWKRNRRIAGIAALALLAFALGLWRIDGVVRPKLPANHLAHWVHTGMVTIEGAMFDPPLMNNDGGGSFVLKAHKIIADDDSWTTAAGKVRIHFRHTLPPVECGATVRLRTRLEYIASPRTPGVYRWDWGEITQGIYLRGRLYSANSIRQIASEGITFHSLLEAIREKVRQRAAAAPAETGALARALVLGEKALLRPDIRESYRRAGIGHVLVVSGLHISAVAGLVFLLLWFAFSRFPALGHRFHPGRLAVLFALPVALLYTALAGASTSVLRACVMFVIAMLALYVGRRRDPLIALAAAACVVLTVYPGALWQAGFQYSFAAVAGMIHWAGLGRKLSELKTFEEEVAPRPLLSPARRWLVRGLVMSAAAFLATVPISLWHFGTIAPGALVANLVALPIYTSLVIPPLLAGSAAAWLAPAVTGWLWAVAALAADQVWGVALLIDALGGGERYLGRPTVIELALLVLLFVSVPYWSRRWIRRAAWATAAVLTVSLIFTPRLAHRFPAQTQVTMIDVGQGMSLHVRTAGGRHLLIDGGYDPRGRLVLPYLLAERVPAVDVLVVTHADPDHCLGLHAVLENLRVGEIWTAARPFAAENAGDYLWLLARAREKQIPVRELKAGESFRFDRLQVDVLNPPEEPPLAWRANDRSLALRIAAGPRNLLVTGDMERSAESHILAGGADLDVEMLQVGHHGSPSSSTPAFLDAVSPRLALIPVGFQNRYRFPAPSVMQSLRRRGTEIWRTDIDGTVRCFAQEQEWMCRSIAPPVTNPAMLR